MSDLIDRQQAIDALDKRFDNIPMEQTTEILQLRKDLRQLPSALGTNLAEVGTDCISRQAAISAICNACGKIDCDKMDKCEKLQLPPANCSEFPNNSDTISRQAAIDLLKQMRKDGDMVPWEGKNVFARIRKMPSAQPDIIRCKDCKYWVPGYITDNDDFIPPKCGEWQQMVGHSSDDYCSLAERREVTT